MNYLKKILEKYKVYIFIFLGIVLVLLAVIAPRRNVIDPTNANFSKQSYGEKEEVGVGDIVVNYEEDINATYEGDKNFTEALRIHYENNPWYSQIPLEKEFYVIIYDFDSASFRIRLKYPKDMYSENEWIAHLEKAMEDIRSFGLSEFDYYYVFTE